MAIAMSADGVFRELVLRRYASAATANVLSAVLGVIFIALITRRMRDDKLAASDQHSYTDCHHQ